jgi:hypothetical protein
MKSKEVLTGFAIVVADRGFVYVGSVVVSDDWCVVTDARNVRKYGTTKGLGQLAQEGPQTDTVLDSAGTVRIPLRGVMHLIETEVSKWNCS